MSRLRDQQILSFAAGHIWATDPLTRNTLLSILTRHYKGLRLSDEDLAEIRQSSSRRPSAGDNGGAVAVVPLWGPLVPHAGMMVDLSTEGTGLDEWSRMFRAAASDPEVSTVLIRVHSPGGSAQGVTEAAKVIRDARASKRIVAVADGMAASAAYALASQADELYVTPSGFVGAVHCYSVHEDISAMLEAEGVKLTLIGAPNAGAAEMPEFLPLSDDNLAHLQSMVEQFYSRFVSDVAKGRGTSESAVRSGYGDGHVLTSGDALAAGMVDGVKSYEEVLSMLAGKGRSSSGRSRAAASTPVGAAALSFGQAIEHGISLASGLPNGSFDITFNGLNAATAAHPGGTPNEGGRTMDTVTTDGRPATLEEWAAKRDSLIEQMNEIDREHTGRKLPEDVQERFDALEREKDDAIATIANIQDRQARLAQAPPAAQVAVEGPKRVYSNVGRNIPDNLFDLAAYRGFASDVEELPKLWKEGALRVNETARYETANRDRVRGFVELLLDKDHAKTKEDSFGLRILGAGNPLYEEAIAAKIAKRPMTPAQENAFRMAVSNTGLGSESPVPITIDPTLLLDSDGTTNPLRRLARNVAITGNTWQGLASDGVTFAYSAELAAVNPVSPTFRGPKAEVVRAIAEIQGSWEVFGDWSSLRGDLATILADAKNNAEADKFLFGTGSDEPEGLIWALDDDGSSVVQTATANTLTLDDVDSVTTEMPQRFDEAASWVANKAFYSNVRALAGAEGRIDVWVPLQQGFSSPGNGSLPSTLLGYGASSASEVSKLFTTGNEIVAVLGDYQRGFVIVDRIGMNLLFDEIVRDGNGKVIGAAALIAVVRNTSKLLSANAFRYLQIKHT